MVAESEQNGARPDRNRAVEDLLAPILDLPAADQEREFAALVAAHPDRAADLHQRFGHFQRLLRAIPAEPCAVSGSFGEFELLRELGRGGMGVVYLARQERAGRDRLVALKLVRAGGLLSPAARERLHREAAVAFELDDPGICPVFDVGEVDGVPWLSMRYVDGRTLAEHIADARDTGALDLPTTALARAMDDDSTTTGAGVGAHRHAAVLMLGELLARSLHTAHEAGFVHRDVKPGNIMVTPQGQPVLLDFGLVRDSSDADGLTVTGEVLGTPAYMAPEQIEGNGLTGRTADVYSLAATLYEAITLRRPFVGSTRAELFHNILHRSVPDMRRLASGVSRDLQLVFATAMARDPRHRYATAMDFAQELRRIRRREPILAKPPGMARRALLWSRRNRLAATLLAGLVVTLVVVLVAADAAFRASDAARQNLAGVRRAVAELIRVQHEELDDIPGLGELRRDMQERALVLLRDVRATAGDDSSLALDNAEALVLGAMLELTLGRPPASAALLAEAEELLRDHPDSDLGRSVRGYWWLVKGELEERAARIDGAIAGYRSAVEELTFEGASDEDTVRAIRALVHVSEMHERRNERESALAAVDRAVELGRRFGGRPQATTITSYAGALRQRAQLYRESDRSADAEADLEAATTALRALIAAGRDNRHSRYRLADCLTSHASLLRVQGRDDERREMQDAAVTLLEDLTTSFPSMASYRSALALALSNRAALLAAGGDPVAARASLERAIAVIEPLVAAAPMNARYRKVLAQAHFNLGNRLRDDRTLAKPHFRAALHEIERVVEQQPDYARHLELATRAAMNLAIAQAMDDEPDAAATFARARHHADGVLRLRPGDRRTKRLRGLLLYNEGAFRADHGDFAAALPLLDQAVDQAQESFTAAPANVRRAADVIRWRTRLAQVTELAGFADAAAAWQQADAAWRDLRSPVRDALDQDPDARLARLVMQRALLAPSARAGDSAARRALQRVVDEAAAIVRDTGPNDESLAEVVLGLLDCVGAAAAAGDAESAAEARRAIVARLLEWPADQVLGGLSRAMFEPRLPELRRITAVDPSASAVLDRLLADG